MLIDKIFVYGSLRSDMFNYEKLLKGKVSKVIKGTIKGKLFHIENKGYPAVICGDNKITGELMELKDFDKSLIELDNLENYNENQIKDCEYIRTLVEVELDCGRKEKAYYYEYNISTKVNLEDKLIEIPHGDWKEYIQLK